MSDKLRKQIEKTDKFFEKYGQDLTDLESNVLRLYYGLDNGKTKTIKELSKIFMCKMAEIEKNLDSSIQKMGFAIYGYYNLLSLIFDGDVPPIYQFNLIELKEIMDKAFELLKEQDRVIIQGRLCIYSRKKYTLESLGNQFNISKERVRQLEKTFIKKLRSPVISEPLKTYLSQIKNDE